MHRTEKHLPDDGVFVCRSVYAISLIFKLVLLSAAWIAFILPSFRMEESYPFINGTYHKQVNYVQRNVYVDDEFSLLKNTSKKYSIIPCRFRTAVYDGSRFSRMREL